MDQSEAANILKAQLRPTIQMISAFTNPRISGEAYGVWRNVTVIKRLDDRKDKRGYQPWTTSTCQITSPPPVNVIVCFLTEVTSSHENRNWWYQRTTRKWQAECENTAYLQVQNGSHEWPALSYLRNLFGVLLALRYARYQSPPRIIDCLWGRSPTHEQRRLDLNLLPRCHMVTRPSVVCLAVLATPWNDSYQEWQRLRVLYIVHDPDEHLITKPSLVKGQDSRWW